MKNMLLIVLCIFAIHSIQAKKRSSKIEIGLHYTFAQQARFAMGTTRVDYLGPSVTQLQLDADAHFINKKDIQIKGMQSPAVMIKYHLFNNIWVSIQPSLFHVKTTASQPFTLNDYSTNITTYQTYNKQYSGVQTDYGFLYQWMNSPTFYFASGIGGTLFSYQYKSQTTGYSFGCFGGHDITDQRDEKIFSAYSLQVNQQVAYKVGKGKQIGYHLSYDALNNRMRHGLYFSYAIQTLCSGKQ